MRDNSGTAMRIIIMRDNTNLSAGQSSYFCWTGSCYSPFADESIDTLSLLPGEENRTFKSYIDPMGIAGTSRIGYTFRDVSSGVVALLRLQYVVGPSASKQPLGNAISFYPNPSTSALTVQRSGQLKLYSIEGKVASTLAVKKGQPVNLAQLTKGNYHLQLDGKLIGTWRKE